MYSLIRVEWEIIIFFYFLDHEGLNEDTYHMYIWNCNHQIKIIFHFTSYIKCKYYFAPFREYSQRDAPRMQLVPWIDTRKKHRGLDQLRGRGLDEQWWVSQFETVACSDHHAMSMMPAHASLVYLVLRPEVEKQWDVNNVYGDSFPSYRIRLLNYESTIIALRFKYDLSMSLYT